MTVSPPCGCETVPSIISISPDGARTGELVDDALVQGSGFVVNQTNVRLTMSGESDIIATDVTVAGDGNSLTCDFDLTGAAGGTWNLAASTPLCPAGMLADGSEVRLCPDPFADKDEDGDVGQDDFAGLQACFTGGQRRRAHRMQVLQPRQRRR